MALVSGSVVSGSDPFEKVRGFLSENPLYFCILLILIGVFFLAAAIGNWGWVFRGRGYNTNKIDGVSNIYGRGAARVLFGFFGVLIILGGVVWLIMR